VIRRGCPSQKFCIVTSVSTVGSTKVPPCAARLPPTTTSPFLKGVGDAALDLFDRLHVDPRPDHSTRLEPVGDLQRPGGLGEALGKGVIDAVLHQDAVGAHAGLAGIAVFRGDGTLNRHLDVGVVEDDELCVTRTTQRA